MLGSRTSGNRHPQRNLLAGGSNSLNQFLRGENSGGMLAISALDVLVVHNPRLTKRALPLLILAL